MQICLCEIWSYKLFSDKLISFSNPVICDLFWLHLWSPLVLCMSMEVCGLRGHATWHVGRQLLTLRPPAFLGGWHCQHNGVLSLSPLMHFLFSSDWSENTLWACCHLAYYSSVCCQAGWIRFFQFLMACFGFHLANITLWAQAKQGDGLQQYITQIHRAQLLCPRRALAKMSQHFG